jgi:hypothetical protein
VTAELRPGLAVVVTDGLSKGLRGVVRERAKVTFGDIPVWAVDLGGLLGVRALREDFLRPAEVGS